MPSQKRVIITQLQKSQSFTNSVTDLGTLYNRNEMISPKVVSNATTLVNDLARMNESSVWWQPKEIHKAIRDRTQKPKNRDGEIEFYKEFSPNTDIYQLGCTLWEMFSYGKTPFQHNFMDINFSTDVSYKNFLFKLKH